MVTATAALADARSALDGAVEAAGKGPAHARPASGHVADLACARCRARQAQGLQRRRGHAPHARAPGAGPAGQPGQGRQGHAGEPGRLGPPAATFAGHHARATRRHRSAAGAQRQGRHRLRADGAHHRRPEPGQRPAQPGGRAAGHPDQLCQGHGRRRAGQLGQQRPREAVHRQGDHQEPGRRRAGAQGHRQGSARNRHAWPATRR